MLSAGGGADAPRGRGPARRSDYGLTITGLPKGCSWQDLKDFMRKAGDVIYSDIDKYGDGVVEFSNREDMEKAIRILDDTEFRNYGESSYVRVKARKSGGDDRRSRSRSRSRSPSPRDKKRDRSPSSSRSRSRSRSPVRSRSPSPVRGGDREEDRRED